MKNKIIFTSIIIFLCILLMQNFAKAQTHDYTKDAEYNKKSSLLVNEVAYNYRYKPDLSPFNLSSDYYGVIWIEIVNRCNKSICLNGLGVGPSGPAFVIRGNVTLNPGEYALLTNNVSYLEKHYKISPTVKIITIVFGVDTTYKKWKRVEISLDRNNIYQGIPEAYSPTRIYFGGFPSLPDGCSWSRFSGFYNTGRFEEDFYIETHPTPGKPNRISKSEDSPMLHIHIPDEYDFNSAYILIASTSITVLFIIFGVIKYGKKRGIKL